ncbi:MAG: PD-(D/E)XK nuclease family protein, partial [Elusimicrobiota bacterium]
VKEEMIDTLAGAPANRWKVALADLGCTEAEYEDTLKNLETVYLNDEEEEEFKKRGILMLENYFKDNQTNPNKIVAVEKQLMITYKGLDLLAFIDRIEKTPDGKIEVIDYKSGQRTMDEEHIKGGEVPQAELYTMMVQNRWKTRLRNFYFYYLSKREKVKCNPPQRFIDRTFERMLETADNIRYKRFQATPGPLCGWCDYEVVCPEWRGVQSPFRGIFRAARERGRTTFSYSKMSMYKNCPYSYKKLYIDKIPMKPKNFFSIGHSCHETMEEFFTQPYQSSLKQLRRMYENRWHREGYKNELEEREFFDNGWDWLEKYYVKYVEGQFIPAHEVEIYFQLPIGNDYVMNGYLDRLQKNSDGTYEIFDYKTDPKLRTQEEVDRDLQLTAYYWAMKQRGIEVGRLSLEFLQFTQRISTGRTEKDIPLFINDVNKTVGEMAYGEERLKTNPERSDKFFPPKVNKYCGGCDYLHGCPMEHDIKTKYRDKVMNLEEEPVPEPAPEMSEEESEEEKEEK